MLRQFSCGCPEDEIVVGSARGAVGTWKIRVENDGPGLLVLNRVPHKDDFRLFWAVGRTFQGGQGRESQSGTVEGDTILRLFL